MKTTFGVPNRFRRWSIFGAVLLFIIAGSVSGALAQALSGGTLDPTTIPKYVTPLVIPPVMKTLWYEQRLRHCGTAVPAADPAGRHLEHDQRPGGCLPRNHGV